MVTAGKIVLNGILAGRDYQPSTNILLRLTFRFLDKLTTLGGSFQIHNHPREILIQT